MLLFWSTLLCEERRQDKRTIEASYLALVVLAARTMMRGGFDAFRWDGVLGMTCPGQVRVLVVRSTYKHGVDILLGFQRCWCVWIVW